MIVPFTCLLLVTLSPPSESLKLPARGGACSKLDSCSSKSSLKTCSCDGDCYLFGTCCHDARNRARQDASDRFECYHRRTASPVFARASCSKDFRGHAATVMACLDGDEDEMDVANNLLVTSFETNVTYRNRDCAACNKEASAGLRYWNIAVYCPSHEGVDSTFIRRNLTFDPDKLRWGIMIDEEFLQCVVVYLPPSDIVKVKYCTPNVISSCPVGYKSNDISLKCSRYYAERRLRNSETYFRNTHCALCNDGDIKDLECPGMSDLEDSADEGDFHETMEVVFTKDEWLDMRQPGKRYECSEGFAYDPGRERCRRFEIEPLVAPISNSAQVTRIGSLALFLTLLTFLQYINEPPFLNNISLQYLYMSAFIPVLSAK